jgi:hypothetical protein
MVVEPRQVGVGDVAEGRAQAVVERLMEQACFEARAYVFDEVVREPRLVLGGRMLGGSELRGYEPLGRPVRRGCHADAVEVWVGGPAFGRPASFSRLVSPFDMRSRIVSGAFGLARPGS